jgi:hypothetical protein
MKKKSAGRKILTVEEIERRCRSGESLGSIWGKATKPVTGVVKKRMINDIETSLLLRKGELYGLARKVGLEPADFAQKLIKAEENERGSGLRVISIIRSRSKADIRRITEEE